MNKILLTGSSGLLGNSLKNILSNYYLVDCLAHSEIVKNIDLFKHYDFIIHCAANTNVEQCEVNKSASYFSNFELTKVIVDNANINSKFIYISSCGVYGDANKLPKENSEIDVCSPTTIHHTHKLLSEKYIKTYLNNFLICRVGWLYGSTADWVSCRLIELSKNESLYGNISQFGNMSEVSYVSTLIIELLKKDINGIFNLGNKNSYSRFEFLKCISDFVGKKVVGVDKEYFKRLANVPNNESINLTKLENTLNIELVDSMQSLKYYLIGKK